MKIFTSLSILLLIAGYAVAAPVEWAAEQRHDLIVDELAVSPLPSRHTEHEPVRFAWPMSIERSADALSGPTAESREYWIDANGAELGYGLSLPLSAPGAVVRISALDANSDARLDAASLSVELDGHALAISPDEAGIRLVTGADLQTLGMAVPASTLAFQLPEAGEPRMLNLALTGLPAEQALVVHVFEPHSRWSGRITGTRHDYLAGEKLRLDIGLSSGAELLPADSVQAVLVSPDAAHAWPLKAGADGMSLSGTVPTQLPDTGPGLYEIHAYLQSRHRDTVIRRDLKLAINIATPSARLLRKADARFDNNLTVTLDVEVASRGRYQVNGQVWGSDANGRLQPLAMAHSAAILEAGQGQITLEVPADVLRESGLGEPFEVRQIELLDQGRMGVIERHHSGLRIGSTRPSSRTAED